MQFQHQETLGTGDIVYGSGVSDVLVHDINGKTYAYVLSVGDRGVSAYEMTPSGQLVFVDQMALPQAFEIGARPSQTVTDIGGASVLLLDGQDLDGSGAIVLGNDGSFAGLGSYSGVTDRLDGSSIVDVGGRTILYSEDSAGGLRGVEMLPNGSLQHVTSLGDTASFGIADIAASTTATVGAKQFLFTTSASENTVSSFRIESDASLTPVDWIGAADGLGLNGASDIATLDVSGQTFLVAGAADSSALAVFGVDADGALAFADYVRDDLSTRFEGVTAIDTIEIGSRGFLAAGGGDDGISLFEMMPDGRLVHLSTVADTTITTLQNVTAITLATTGGTLQVLAAGEGDFGVTRFSVDISDLGASVVGTDGQDTLTGGASDDLLFGGDGNDDLSGGGGHDIFYDGAGQDSLTGGAGADHFIFTADGEADIITDFELGLDRLDLSAFLFLYGVDQLGFTQTATGALLTHGAETITLNTADGQPLTAGDLNSITILNLDRPPFFAADQTLTGTAAGDTLYGGLGLDTITSGAGNDVIDGRDGDDTIDAGTGEDHVTGGSGNDQIFGGAGFDIIWAGDGEDTVYGGDQADIVYGGAHSDTLFGENGVDTLYGEAGDDALYGADGNDRLWGGDGADALYGGFQEDRLYGEDGDDLLLGDGGFDYLDGGDGNDLMNGGGQADNLFGRAGDDRLLGEGGFDRLFGGPGDDLLRAGDGDDGLFGEQNDDTLFGDAGNDRVWGGVGNDILFGGDGADTIYGGAGFDVLHGEAGDDILTGNFNADTFVFADGDGQDTITDFDATNIYEKIDLSDILAITSWNDLSSNHLSQNGQDVIIDTGSGGSITLSDVLLSDLDSSDFLF